MRNNADSTPLHTAAQNGHVQVAETLLGGGADVNLLNADGSTALAVAKERGHSALAKLLERAAGKAQLGRTLKEMSERDDSTWKVGEMKNALRFSGVDVDSISEKAELLSLTRDLIANPPVAAAVPDISDSSPAPAPAPALAPKPGGRAGGFFAAAAKGKRAPAPVEEEESDEEGKDAVAAGAERAKAAGNEAFGRGDFLKAVKHFGSAIRLAPKNHVLYSNRSGAHASLGNHVEALSDAENCIKLAPTWAKGYGRQGAALILCGQYKKAVKAYKAGLEIEPGNAGLTKGLEDLRASLREGEVPDANGGDQPKAAPKPAAAPKASAPPKAAAAGGGGGGVSASLPIGQQWIEHAKRSDRAAMEALLAQDASLITYKARGIGHTAMHWAASTGDRPMMEWLVSLNADVNARNSSDATPLHTAAGSGQAMSVEWLLAHGADGTLANDDGLTPADAARKKDRLDLASTIERYMASPPVAAPPPTEHEEEVD